MVWQRWAHGNTAEGKVVTAAFLDAYNSMVGTIRNSPELVRDTATVREEAMKTARAEPSANKSDNAAIPANTLAGSIVRSKISKVRHLDLVPQRITMQNLKATFPSNS